MPYVLAPPPACILDECPPRRVFRGTFTLAKARSVEDAAQVCWWLEAELDAVDDHGANHLPSQVRRSRGAQN